MRMLYYVAPLLVAFNSAARSADQTPEPPLDAPDRGVLRVSAKTETAAPLPQAAEISTNPQVAVDAVSRCRQLSDDVRDRTHFIVINGVDPFHIGGLNRFCRSIEGAGFKNVHLSPMRGYRTAEKKINAIRQSDPEAKIVLAGYSWGANEVRAMCNALNNKGVNIDLLVYLGGDMVGNRAASRPENAGRVLNINAHGLMLYGYDLFWNGEEIDGAKNVRIDTLHLGLPRRNETLDLLLTEVADINSPQPQPVPAKELKGLPVNR